MFVLKEFCVLKECFVLKEFFVLKDLRLLPNNWIIFRSLLVRILQVMDGEVGQRLEFVRAKKSGVFGTQWIPLDPLIDLSQFMTTKLTLVLLNGGGTFHTYSSTTIS